MTDTTSQGAADAPYWEAAASGRLLLRRSRSTGEVWRHDVQPPPQADGEWFEATGKGVVRSLIVLHGADDPATAALTARVVAEIQLEEGPTMHAAIIGPGALDARTGDAVRCVFEARGQGVNVPQFLREEAGADD